MKHTNQLPAILVGCLLAVVMTASTRAGFAATQSEASALTRATPAPTPVRTSHRDTGTITAAPASDSDLDTYIETRLESAHMPSL